MQNTYHENSVVAASGSVGIYEPWLVYFVGHALGVLDSSDSQNSSPSEQFFKLCHICFYPRSLD